MSSVVNSKSIVPPRAPRLRVSLDGGWRYLEDRTLDTAHTARWAAITLPHTWNALDATDLVPGYRRDASWYRRALDVSRYPGDTRLVLHFEAANTVADVYVNGRRAGGHVGGYVGFDVDVTPYVRRDGPNDILVRVSNAERADLIPSAKQDYVIYGGLTRDVWLDALPPVSIAHVSVRTPQVDSARADLTARVDVANPTHRTGGYTVALALSTADGRVVARAASSLTLASDSAHVTIALPELRRPELWSPTTPALYRLTATLAQHGATVDSTDERVGLRWFRFDSAGAFSLNGARLLLRGTHRHEEFAGLGNALPNAMHRADMAAIKAMGANYVRLAHYPQDPEVYRAADSLGLLLWDELPWGRGGIGDSAWQTNTRRLLAEQIRQNENHPSIILWSMGNEVTDVMDADDHSARTNPDTVAAFMRRLTDEAHALDPGRPTATRKFDSGWRSVDVYSPSIWAGWYGGVYRDYAKALASAMRKYPRMVHMEYGADAHYGRHTETPITGEGMALDTGTAEKVGKRVANVAREGDWSESYQTDLLDWHLMVSERMPGLTGTAQWAFRDFATPLRPDNPIPYVNEKGLLTRDGRPKDAYFVFKARWTTSPTFAYIVSHTWTERSGPAGVPRDVRVYSNCAAVELVANGASLGTRARDAAAWPAEGLVWPVAFRDGANALEARCADGSARDTLTVRYTTQLAGKPDHIALSTRPLANGHLLVEATLVDAAGRRSLGARDRVYFAHDGAGALVADRGTPTGTRAIEAANGYAAIELVPPGAGERCVVEARTQDINGARITIGGAAR